MGKYRIETTNGVYEIETEDAPATPAPSTAPVARSASDAPAPRGWSDYSPLEASEGIDEGIKKMARRTMYGGGDIIRRMTGGPRIIGTPEVQKATTTVGPWEGLGGGLETGIEFLAGSGLASRGEKTLRQIIGSGRFAPALNFLGGAGLEAGAAAGVAGLQTGGDPEAMEEAALYAGGGTLALGAAQKALGPYAKRLHRKALEQYERVLNPTKEKFKYAAHEKVVPELLERGETFRSMESMKDYALTQSQKWGQAVDDAYAALPPGSAVPLDPVFKQMDDMIAPLYTKTSRGVVTKGPVADEAIANMNRMRKVLLDHAEVNPATGVREIPVDRIRDLRQHFDDVASDAGAFHGKTLSEKNMVSAYEKSGNAIRAELAKPYPDIAKINKEYSFWRNLVDVHGATELRRVGQAKGMGRQLASVGGMGVGGYVGHQIGGTEGAVIGTLLGQKLTDMFESAVTSPAWRTVSAVTKDKLAKAIAKGDRPGVEFWLRKIGASIGGTAAASRSSQRATQRPAEAR